MALSSDIAATYRGPGKVIARLLGYGIREDRALAMLMGGCFVMFIAQWPRLARDAHFSGGSVGEVIGGEFATMIFVLPLLFYLLAFAAHGLMRLLKGQGDSYNARLALFWSFLAVSPLILLQGLVAGFIGPGLQLELVKLLCWLVFLWFGFSGLRKAYWGAQG
ncbi:YIP1 family protein [Tropicibacter sp. R15_0]|uniref:YIP1 family protein n=1 Tax=Tropicibacter sp. R15_0 TaxID=2821101 RepID=UPI001ADBA468|nr:YIP1 family protein [Tropicibacter sp. R15_0]MBO9466006.1 YIP1 family protein [Tropicibacter sp. R15_0]